MRVIGMKIRNMDMDGNYYQMVHSMRVIIFMENLMEKGNLYGQMKNIMWENGIWESEKDKVNLNSLCRDMVWVEW